MTKQNIIQFVIIAVIIISHFILTKRYFLKFKKNIIFTGGIRKFHLIMMWIVPFVWILFLQALTKSTPGSYEIEKKEDPEPFPKSGYGGMHTSN